MLGQNKTVVKIKTGTKYTYQVEIKYAQACKLVGASIRDGAPKVLHPQRETSFIAKLEFVIIKAWVLLCTPHTTQLPTTRHQLFPSSTTRPSFKSPNKAGHDDYPKQGKKTQDQLCTVSNVLECEECAQDCVLCP